MKIKPLPPLEYLRECFELSDTSPSGLVWKVRPREHFASSRGHNSFNARLGGRPAGSISHAPSQPNKPYWRVKLLDGLALAHRVVYSIDKNVELSTDVEIDHRDSDGLNNKTFNLRSANRTLNNHNQVTRKDNTSGIKGLNYHKQNGTWYGVVHFNGRRYSTGYSPSKEIIIELVRELRESLHKEFTNHGN